MSRSRALENFDWVVLGLGLILSVLGLVTLFSATYVGVREGWELADLAAGMAPQFRRQVVFLGVAFAVFLVVVAVDYRYVDSHAYLLYAAGLAALGYVLLFGETRGGSTRWIDLGPVSFQPSELMKPLTVLALAHYLARRETLFERGMSLRDLFVPLGIVAVPFGLIVVEPDLGTALLVAFVSMAVLFAVGIDWRTLGVLALVGVLAAPVVWTYGLQDYHRRRIKTMLNPTADPTGAGYHVRQSRIAVGSGQFGGKGFLQGTQGSLQFLPEHHTDFIFTVVAEEKGWVGSMALLSLYGLLLGRGLGIARRAKDRFGALLAVGLSAILFWHVLVNVAMVMGMMPVVGVPLPFLSYGGTFLTVSFLNLGLLANVSMRRFMF